ncbi:MAG: biotin--[acetyl-CoA-carboxylase] ligase [Saprospiraceae bacterium]
MSNTLFVGKVYLRFDELPSTNDYARDLVAKSKPAEGTVVRAASQSAGRGQYGSRWESEPGQNLTLSVIFYPFFLPVSEQFRLSEAVALAVLDTVDWKLEIGNWKSEGPHSFPQTGFDGQFPVSNFQFPIHRPSSTVKWPNDIYLGDRKAAGILIQNSLAGAHIQSSVVGIGLNVNQMVFRSDAPNPVSLAQATGRFFDLDEVADSLFKNLEVRYLQLKTAAGWAAIRAEYEQRLYRLGELSKFRYLADDSVFEGIIRGVAADGRLRVEAGEAERLFAVKEIGLVVG